MKGSVKNTKKRKSCLPSCRSFGGAEILLLCSQIVSRRSSKESHKILYHRSHLPYGKQPVHAAKHFYSYYRLAIAKLSSYSRLKTAIMYSEPNQKRTISQRPPKPRQFLCPLFPFNLSLSLDSSITGLNSRATFQQDYLSKSACCVDIRVG
jgi:hypothetical protein